MIKIENHEVVGWEHAIRGMRNPMNSWDKIDSNYCIHTDNEEFPYDRSCPYYTDDGCDYHGEVTNYLVGPNDHDLMMRLANGGPVHAKYRRMIGVYVDITAPLYWWKEFDTYKVGTVANSCSTMHKIHEKEFTLDDFSCEHLVLSTQTRLDDVINELNHWRNVFIEGGVDNNFDGTTRIFKPKDKDAWWQMIQLLPSSYNQKRTVFLNYEVLANIYEWRKEHKLDEWRELCKWIESLPYSEIITEPVKKKHTIAELTASLDMADERIEQLEKENKNLQKEYDELKKSYKYALSNMSLK